MCVLSDAAKSKAARAGGPLDSRPLFVVRGQAGQGGETSPKVLVELTKLPRNGLGGRSANVIEEL